MITSVESEVIKKYIGRTYSAKILSHLKTKGVTNNGKPFSVRSITSIVNGERSNIEIETEIFKMVETAKNNFEKLEKLKKQIK